MNLEKLRAAGFSDDEIHAHVASKAAQLKAAGFTDMEIEAKYGPNTVSQPEPQAFDFDKAFDEIRVKDASDVMVGETGTPTPVVDVLYEQFVKPWQAIGFGSAAAFNRSMAIFSTHVSEIFEYAISKRDAGLSMAASDISKKVTGSSLPEVFKGAADIFNANKDYWAKRAEDVGPTFLQELVGEAVGGAVPGITEFLLNVPYAGILGAAEASKEGGNEVGRALTEMAKRGVLGAVFHVMAPLQNYLRAPMFGTVFGAQSAFEGGEPRDIAKAAGTGVLYSVASPGGRYGLNELRENLRDSMRKTERRVEEVRAGEAPEAVVEEPVKAEGETAAKTETTGNLEQAVIPGASEAETFNLTGAPGEIGQPAPTGAKQRTVDWTKEVINENPVFQHVEAIKSGGGISKEKLLKDYDAETVAEISKRNPGLIRKEGGRGIDDWAQELEYESGDALFNALSEKPTKKEAARQAKEEFESSGLGEKARIAKKGYEPLTEPVIAGDLNKGDQLLIDGEKYKVKGEKKGNIVLEDGKTITVDVFEPIEAEGIKRKMFRESASSPAMAPEKDFRRTPDGKEKQQEQPIGRSEIKEFLEEKLGQTIRVGRFRTPNALGIFKSAEEVVRIKNANDIEVISHEIGHAIQKFLWPESIVPSKGYTAQPFTAFKGELDPIATTPKKGSSEITAEGFAEFMRLYVTDAKQAQAKAPSFFNYFEAQLGLKAPEVKEILLEARKKYDLFMKQPSLQRVMSQISVGENQRRKAQTFDELYTMTVDDLHPLEVVVKEMAGGQKLEAAKDPYKLARLMKGWTGKAEAFLKNRPFDFNTYKDVPGSKSLKEILAPVKDDLDTFRAYIVSKRALELSGRDIETGILKEDAEAVVKDYDGKYRKVFEELKQFQDHSLNYLKQSGLIDDAAFTAMRAANADYVPFYRVMEDAKGYGVGTGLQSRQPIKGIKGSWRDIVDPLESIIKNTFTYINLAEKNAVGRALVDLAKSKEGLGKYAEKIPTPMKAIEIKESEVPQIKAINQMYAEMQTMAEQLGLGAKALQAVDDVFTVFRPSSFIPKENVISVWDKGKRELYQVHPDIARTFQALDAEQTNLILRILSKPAQWLRAGATLTPEFIARNPLRDQWSAFIFSKYGFVPAFDTVRGVFSMAKRDSLYWDWKKGGGDHSMMVSMDRDYLQDALGDVLQQYPLRNVVKNPIGALRLLSELGEAGTRLGEMAAAERKLGRSKQALQEAAFASREVTLDFNRIGAKTKAVNSIIAFWNAQVQGMDKMGREFKNNPVGTLTRTAAAITLPSVLLAIATHGDERLKEVPQWQKDLFWVVPTDSGIWRIPKPFELGILFGSIPERVTHFILDQDPKAFDNVLESLGRGFSPGMVPTIAAPIVENWANKSFFFDRSIVPRSREDLLPEYQYGEFTTETAKRLGQIVGKFPGMDRTKAASPAYIENLVRGWTGGLGKYALDIADAGLRATGVTEEKYEKPSKTMADIPFVKAFAVRYPAANAASIEKFYDSFEKAQAVNKTVKVLLNKEQNPELAMKLWQESGMADLSGMHQALGAIRNTIDLVYRNPSMTGDEKRQLIDTMYLQMIQIAAQGNEMFEQHERVMKQYR